MFFRRLCIVSALLSATLHGQGFSDYLFVFEEWQNKSEAPAPGAHSWEVVRFRCRRLSASPDGAFEAEFSILDRRLANVSDKGTLTFDAAVPFGFEWRTVKHLDRAEGTGMATWIGKVLLLEVNAQAGIASARDPSEEKPADAGPRWMSEKAIEFSAAFPFLVPFLAASALRITDETTALPLPPQRARADKPRFEQAPYGKRVRVSMGGPGGVSEATATYHAGKAGELLGLTMIGGTSDADLLHLAARGELPMPAGGHLFSMSLRRIEADGLLWNFPGVFKRPGFVSYRRALTILDSAAPGRRAFMVPGRPPLFFMGQQAKDLHDLRRHMRAGADPTLWPMKEKADGTRLSPVGHVSGRAVWPSRIGLEIRCDPEMHTAWMLAVLQLVAVIPGKQIEKELRESPFIWQTRWGLGGTSARIDVPCPWPDVVLTRTPGSKLHTLRVRPEKQHWHLVFDGGSNVNGLVMAVALDQEDVVLETRPKGLVQRLKKSVSTLLAEDPQAIIDLDVHPKAPFGLTFALMAACKEAGVGTLRFVGAPRDLLKNLANGMHDR